MIDENKLLERAKIRADINFCGVDKCAISLNELQDTVNSMPKVGEWISCSERMPEERESMFAKLKGTSLWRTAMFEKCSNDVNVTVELSDGKRITATSHTIDGEWKEESLSAVKKKVIAWMPLPEAYKE